MLNTKLTISLMSILALLLIFNQFQVVALHKMMMDQSDNSIVAGTKEATGSPDVEAKPRVDLAALAREILPTGIPVAYGAELGVSYDNAAAAIPVLAPYEQDSREVKLTGEKLKRYIDIGQMTSCEYCCGAKTMVFAEGSKACGCAHSAAMRGLVAYLLDNTDMTNEEILVETNKLKARFFPGPTVKKYAAEKGLLGTSSQDLARQVGGC